MNKFEKKFGKYAIQNISLILILCYVVGYVISLINGNFLSYLTLNPYEILFHGQIWRLVTWIIIPPGTLDPFTIIMLLFYYNIGTTLERTWGTYRYNVYLLMGMLFTVLGRPPGTLDPFTIIMLLFYYNIGTTLERTWGTYRYNVYLLMGMLFTVLGSFACMGINFLSGASGAEVAFLSAIGANFFSTYYINMSIFLAFAATFPNVQVLLMFVIPIKVKWMGIVYIVLMAWEFLMTGNMYARMAIGASLLNVAIFFFTSKNRMHLSPKQIKRRSEFKQQVKQSAKKTGHRCAVCGRTEEDDPTLEFRYCSKCEGNYEYCQYHLFTHEHVRKK